MRTRDTRLLARLEGVGAVLVATALIAGQASAYSDLFVFSDSLSDTGNVCPEFFCPSPPYDPGRWSNGPVWVDTISSSLSIAPESESSATGGNNYAVGGATTADLVNLQIPAFSTAVGGTADADGLYILFAGANDYNSVSATTAAQNMITAINDLSALGAESFLVANLVDLGKAPAFAGSEAAATQFSLDFNDELATQIAALTGVTIFEVDFFTLFEQIAASPATFGLTNVTDPCWDGITACATPGDYYFWDMAHPTTAAHEVLAQEALSAIPEPATALLLATGLAALAARRRRLH